MPREIVEIGSEADYPVQGEPFDYLAFIGGLVVGFLMALLTLGVI